MKKYNFYPQFLTLSNGEKLELSFISSEFNKEEHDIYAVYEYSYFVKHENNLLVCKERDGGLNKDNNEQDYYFNNEGYQIK